MIIEKLIIEHKHSEFLDSKSVNFDIQKKNPIDGLTPDFIPICLNTR